MKMLNSSPLRVLQAVLAFCAASVIISSCSKYSEDVSPSTGLKTASVRSDAYAKQAISGVGPLDCSALNGSSLNNKYRAKTVSIYGASAGPWYDGLANAYKTNPNAYALNPAYSKIYNYKSQITAAIQKGAKDLTLSYCTANTLGCNTQIFWSSYLKDAIDVYLNPIKSAISNDGALTVLEKGILNGVIQTYYDNFEEATSYYGIDGRACFPDPSWYGDGGTGQSGVFGGIGKAIRKIINIAATIVTEIVEYAVYGALYGAILGVPVAVVGSVPAAAYGAVVGGFIGLIAGIDRCIKGNYICLVSCI